jgi:hypothetical protein
MAIQIDDGRWHPGIGDPTLIGWFTVLAYGLAALLCYGSGKRFANTPKGRFWWGLALVMLALGINKQLDLQSWFTELGRDLALQYGWYGQRRLVQILFIATLLVSAILAWLFLLKQWSNWDKYSRNATYGLVLLIVFVIARATSFHHVDILLGLNLGGLSINGILELSGIGTIAWAAASRMWNVSA